MNNIIYIINSDIQTLLLLLFLICGFIWVCPRFIIYFFGESTNNKNKIASENNRRTKEKTEYETRNKKQRY